MWITYTLADPSEQEYEHILNFESIDGSLNSPDSQHRTLSLSQGGVGFGLGMARPSSIPVASGNANSPRNNPIAPLTALTQGATLTIGLPSIQGKVTVPGFNPNGSTMLTVLFFA